MSEPSAVATPELTAWQTDLDVVVCEHCQWRYLVPHNDPPALCPNCCHSPLEVFPGGLAEMPHSYPPELVAPFEITPKGLNETIKAFIAQVPFAPKDLTEAHLRSHLKPLFLPMWLVDSKVNAVWRGEVGFDYEVVSHQEFYNGTFSKWETREVKEPRVRWEQRLGRLNRSYQNVTIPAVDDQSFLEQQLGSFSLKQVLPYTPERIQQASVRLPDNAPKEIWNDAALAFQKTALTDCQHACDANQMRQFEWKARFAQINWTLLLLPVYATHYLDDKGKPHAVLFHGQTGKPSGKGRASFGQAGYTSLLILTAGLALFVLGLFLDTLATTNPFVHILSMIFLLIGLAGVLTSPIPFIIAADYNHRQVLDERKEKLKRDGKV